MVRRTGANAVAIGRGCLGNPWIFRDARTLFLGGTRPPPPSPAQRGQVLLRFLDMQVRFMGQGLTLKALPRTACYFAKYVPDFDEFRAGVHRVRNLREVKSLVLSHFR
jgi:tRNA-dihydrouridine synthase